MTLTDEQIELLKKTASAAVPEDEHARLQGEMAVLHKQVIKTLGPGLAKIVFSAQMALTWGHPVSEVLMQMYTSGFALGLAFSQTQELERLAKLEPEGLGKL